MTLELFISILMLSASATSIAVQLMKAFLDRAAVPYKSVPIAVITAFLVGAAEMLIYSITHNMAIGAVTILYAVCMGFANTLSATCGYDLTKKFISALMGRAE